MGQRRVDREWAKPKTTRHVWVAQEGVQAPLVQGFVVEWRRYSYRWFALVLTVRVPKEAAPVVKMEWLRAEQLTPVKSDPNDGRAWRIRR
jgi:hypothetical protein